MVDADVGTTAYKVLLCSVEYYNTYYNTRQYLLKTLQDIQTALWKRWIEDQVWCSWYSHTPNTCPLTATFVITKNVFAVNVNLFPGYIIFIDKHQ